MTDVLMHLSETIVIVSVVLIILASVIFYLRTSGTEQVLYKAALYLVSLAEEEWGSGTGKIKFAEVFVSLKKEYPLLTLFATEETLTDIIEEALKEMKRILKAKQEKAEAEAKLEESKSE